MPHSRFVDANGILTTTVQKAVTLKEINELIGGMHNYIQDDALFEIVIHADDIQLNMNRSESEQSADALRNALKSIQRGAIAFVSSKDFVYGICRQLQMRVENDFFQISVFRTEATARAWLMEMKASNPPGA